MCEFVITMRKNWKVGEGRGMRDRKCLYLCNQKGGGRSVPLFR